MSSDFIVGFRTGRTRTSKATMKLIEEINFDMSFSFIYKPAPGPRPPICRTTWTWR